MPQDYNGACDSVTRYNPGNGTGNTVGTDYNFYHLPPSDRLTDDFYRDRMLGFLERPLYHGVDAFQLLLVGRLAVKGQQRVRPSFRFRPGRRSGLDNDRLGSIRLWRVWRGLAGMYRGRDSLIGPTIVP